MTIHTDHLDRCVHTLGSSLNLYRQTQPGSIDQEVFRNAIIKDYELTHETAFKRLKRALQDFGHGRRKLEPRPVKDILRLSARLFASGTAFPNTLFGLRVHAGPGDGLMDTRAPRRRHPWTLRFRAGR